MITGRQRVFKRASFTPRPLPPPPLLLLLLPKRKPLVSTLPEDLVAI
jgi:hypothetical protein